MPQDRQLVLATLEAAPAEVRAYVSARGLPLLPVSAEALAAEPLGIRLVLQSSGCRPFAKQAVHLVVGRTPDPAAFLHAVAWTAHFHGSSDQDRAALAQARALGRLILDATGPVADACRPFLRLLKREPSQLAEFLPPPPDFTALASQVLPDVPAYSALVYTALAQAYDANRPTVALDDPTAVIVTSLAQHDRAWRTSYFTAAIAAVAARTLSEPQDRSTRAAPPASSPAARLAMIETEHPRKHYKLWVVQPASHVSSVLFARMMEDARSRRGWYSSERANGAVAGFQFRSAAAAHAFMEAFSHPSGQPGDRRVEPPSALATPQPDSPQQTSLALGQPEGPSTGRTTDATAKGRGATPRSVHTPAAPVTTQPILQDAGEKIGGARKDLWLARGGLTVGDLAGMTAGEETKFVVKEQVWPRPDYEALIAAGADPLLTRLTKSIYDGLSKAPRHDTPEGRRDYLRMMGAVRTAVEAASSVADFQAVRSTVRQRIGLSDRSSSDQQEARRVYFSVYRSSDKTLAISSLDLRKAAQDVASGWPSPEPWQRLFDIRSDTTGAIYVTHKGKRSIAADDFPSRDHAIAWAVEQAARLQSAGKATAADKPKAPHRPHLDDVLRTGRDHRNGRDITSDDFIREFGFRAVEFGNWVAGDERQKAVNHAFDALHDLADILDISPKALSLGGRLAVAFGARGGGRFSAHYEGTLRVVNLTKLRGAGSLAHEWGHALDHHFGELDNPAAGTGAAPFVSDRDVNGVFGRSTTRSDRVTGQTVTTPWRPHLRPEIAAAWADTLNALFTRPETLEETVTRRQSQIASTEERVARYKSEILRIEADPKLTKANSKFLASAREFIDDAESRNLPAFRASLDRLQAGEPPTPQRAVRTDYAAEAAKLNGRSGEYWTRPSEMFARALESYVFDRLQERGQLSQYLVQGVEPERFASPAYTGNPYPTGSERSALTAVFDRLFQTMRERTNENGLPVLYDASPGLAPADALAGDVSRAASPTSDGASDGIAAPVDGGAAAAPHPDLAVPQALRSLNLSGLPVGRQLRIGSHRIARIADTVVAVSDGTAVAQERRLAWQRYLQPLAETIVPTAPVGLHDALYDLDPEQGRLTHPINGCLYIAPNAAEGVAIAISLSASHPVPTFVHEGFHYLSITKRLTAEEIDAIHADPATETVALFLGEFLPGYDGLSADTRAEEHIAWTFAGSAAAAALVRTHAGAASLAGSPAAVDGGRDDGAARAGAYRPERDDLARARAPYSIDISTIPLAADTERVFAAITAGAVGRRAQGEGAAAEATLAVAPAAAPLYDTAMPGADRRSPGDAHSQGILASPVAPPIPTQLDTAAVDRVPGSVASPTPNDLDAGIGFWQGVDSHPGAEAAVAPIDSAGAARDDIPTTFSAISSPPPVEAAGSVEPSTLPPPLERVSVEGAHGQASRPTLPHQGSATMDGPPPVTVANNERISAPEAAVSNDPVNAPPAPPHPLALAASIEAVVTEIDPVRSAWMAQQAARWSADLVEQAGDTLLHAPPASLDALSEDLSRHQVVYEAARTALEETLTAAYLNPSAASERLREALTGTASSTNPAQQAEVLARIAADPGELGALKGGRLLGREARALALTAVAALPEQVQAVMTSHATAFKAQEVVRNRMAALDDPTVIAAEAAAAMLRTAAAAPAAQLLPTAPPPGVAGLALPVPSDPTAPVSPASLPHRLLWQAAARLDSVTPDQWRSHLNQLEAAATSDTPVVPYDAIMAARAWQGRRERLSALQSMAADAPLAAKPGTVWLKVFHRATHLAGMSQDMAQRADAANDPLVTAHAHQIAMIADQLRPLSAAQVLMAARSDAELRRGLLETNQFPTLHEASLHNQGHAQTAATDPDASADQDHDLGQGMG